MREIWSATETDVEKCRAIFGLTYNSHTLGTGRVGQNFSAVSGSQGSVHEGVGTAEEEDLEAHNVSAGRSNDTEQHLP